MNNLLLVWDRDKGAGMRAILDRMNGLERMMFEAVIGGGSIGLALALAIPAEAHVL